MVVHKNNEEETTALSEATIALFTPLDMTGRPRRSNPDTIQYLRQLPIVHWNDNITTTSTTTETMETEDAKVEMSYIMLQGLYEIRNELASVASTELGSSVLERMIQWLVNKSILVNHLLWNGLSPYIHHLAVHRYGSHVLQTLIHETTRSILATNGSASHEDIAKTENAPELPEPAVHTGASVKKSYIEWMISLAQSLDMETIQYWMTDQCASHVLRSLMAGLSGRCYNHSSNNNNSTSSSFDGNNNASNRMESSHHNDNKTKKNKKKRKRQLMDEYTMVGTSIIPNGFTAALKRIQDILWDNFDENWPYHSSACPLLCLALQQQQQPNDAPFPTTVKISEEWMYDATASRFWQASVETAPTDSLLIGTIADANRNNVLKYIENDTANYCVQTMLEKHHHWVEECLDQLPYLMDVLNHRRGVLWKLASACKRHDRSKQHQDQIVQAIASYGISKFATEGAPSLAVLVELLPSIADLLTPLVHDLSRNSLASKILVEPWIEFAKDNFPITGHQISELARHPVGQHVVVKYVLVTRTVPNELCELRHSQHPIAKRLFHERLQLPLYENKGVKAWKEAMGIAGTNKKRRKLVDEM